MTTATEKLIEGFEAGTAPNVVRAAAARGALPFPPAVLTGLQVLLLRDADPAIRTAAAASLDALDEPDVQAMLSDRELPERTLAWLAGAAARWPDAAAALARRRDLPPDAAHALCAASIPAILESLAGNQIVLRREPAIGEALAANPALPRAARNRLLDVLHEFGKQDEREALAADAAVSEEPPPAVDPFLAALGIDAEVEQILPTLGFDLDSLAERSELLGDDESDAVYVRLSRMNVGEKLRAAIFGTREERALLVRDTNRIVAAAVVKNPKFTEHEADAVSKSRNVNEEVLRLIGRNREFSSSYQIQKNLVCNPRTPLEIALRFVTRLNDRDLKILEKSRNIPDNVRRQAKKIREVRESRRRGRPMRGRH